MMVKARHTAIAHLAVLASGRPEKLTCPAPTRRIDDLVKVVLPAVVSMRGLRNCARLTKTTLQKPAQTERRDDVREIQMERGCIRIGHMWTAIHHECNVATKHETEIQNSEDGIVLIQDVRVHSVVGAEQRGWQYSLQHSSGVLRQSEHKIVQFLNQAISVPRTLPHQQDVHNEGEQD